MKILFIAPGMRFGGAERVMSIIANELVNRGEKVLFFLTGTPAESSYKLCNDIKIISNYELAQKEIFVHFVHIREIRKQCLSWRPDMVICFYNDLCALAAIATFGLSITLIYSERNDPQNVNKRMIDKIYRKIVEYFANKFVFQSEGAKKYYPKSVQRRSCVIMNPMDTAKFPKHDFSCEEKIIVSVGRLEDQKNQMLLLESFSMIKDKYPDYKLFIYGEGSLRNLLEDYINKNGLEGRVFLPGVKHEIQEYIKKASLFVLSSKYEGIPNALIEAMAIGLPCVSTDFSPGGARELIKHEYSGLIVPNYDPIKLAKAMERMILDRDIAKKCGDNAYLIRKKVDLHTIVDEWQDFLGGYNKNICE